MGDGRGRFRVVRLDRELVIDGPVEHDEPPGGPVTVAFALPKGDRPELIVQKLTELGVDQIVPMVTARTVVRWDDAKAARNVERWRVIAREAAAQAHRTWLPEVAAVTPFAGAAATPGAALADPDGAPLAPERAVVLVGPEGGWAEDELAAVPRRVRLARNVLRTETAAMAAAVLLGAMRGAPPGTMRRLGDF